MSLRTVRVVLLVAGVCLASTPAASEACCWLFGGGCGGCGYTAYRPIFNWGVFRPRYVDYGYASYGGYSNCCPTNCCPTGGCSSGSCGYGSYYTPSCGSCGGTGCSNCTVGCESNYLPGTSDPVPDTTIRNGTGGVTGDDFSGSRSPTTNPSGGSSIPNGGSSIPSGGLPTFPPAGEIDDATGAGRGVNDGGTDAEPWRLPAELPNGNTNPVDPFTADDTNPDGNLLRVEPLEIDSAVAASFKANRRRVQLWSNYGDAPVIARQLPSFDNTDSTTTAAHVASR
jgi:hypothetical protein